MVKINNRPIGDGHPTYIIAEIGINHNGDVEIAKKLIDVAVTAGCDAVKFQKRTPELCVPPNQRDVMRDTPWGRISYMDYRGFIEFEYEYSAIDHYCKERNITWFASCWDKKAVDFMKSLETPCIKIPSACLTDDDLLMCTANTELPVILSTGMSTVVQMSRALGCVNQGHLLLAHCTSTYPTANHELNLNVIKTFKKAFTFPIGYSGHEHGLQTTIAAVVLGANFIERHITLDRSMWGSDHAASLEPDGLRRLVRDIRVVEAALGDGVKRVYDSELPIMEKLRREK